MTKGRKQIAAQASRGGRARAEQASPEEREDVARGAALARWTPEALVALPKETHVGTVRIGEIEISCANLDNGMRVISKRGMQRAMGSKKTGVNETGESAPQVPAFIAAKNAFAFVPDDLLVRLNNPIQYRHRRGVATGYEATLLPEICGVIVHAATSGALRDSQDYLVDRARTLLMGFANVGIIALVDEATGYQADRARDELHKILDAYVREEMRPWLRVFPTEFFRQIYRLQGWEFKEGSMKHPGYVGTLINEVIYARLPEPVLPRLREVNPVVDGRRKRKHHQHLTEDTGIPHLDRQIAGVTMLMRVSTSKVMFEELLARATPKQGEQIPLGLELAAAG